MSTTPDRTSGLGPGAGPVRLYRENLSEMKNLFRKVDDFLLFNGDFDDADRALVKQAIADLDTHEHVRRANVKPMKVLIGKYRQGQAGR